MAAVALFPGQFPRRLGHGNETMAAANSTAFKLVIVTWPYDCNYNQFRLLLLLHLPLPNCTCAWVWCWTAPAPSAEVKSGELMPPRGVRISVHDLQRSCELSIHIVLC